MERVMGIEPTSKAWEAVVLPLNYTRTHVTILLGLTPSDNNSRVLCGINLLWS